MTSVLQETEEERYRQRRSQVEMEAEKEGMQPQPKGCLKLLEAGRGQMEPPPELLVQAQPWIL